MADFKRTLRRYRIEHGLTIDDMAAEISRHYKCSPTLLGGIETGRRRPTAGFIIAFANVSRGSMGDINKLLKSAGLPSIGQDALPPREERD